MAVKENKIIVLCGKSGSGKDTVMKLMLETFKDDIQPIVSDTTRPMREGETDGVEYNFITPAEFAHNKEIGGYLENRSYNTIDNGKRAVWEYGISHDAIDLDKHNYITIVDLDGLEVIKNRFGRQVVSMYISVDDETREERAKSRGSFNQAEWNRRLKSDNDVFGESNVYNAVDHIMPNYDASHTFLAMRRCIARELKLQ